MNSTEQHSILIVDDDIPLLETLSEIFRSEGWNVHSAGNIQEALKTLENDKVEVVLSDVRMPAGGGLELATNMRDLRSKQKGLVLFFMTGFSDYPDSVLLSMGAKEVFRKPFEAGECIEKIRAAVEKA